MRYPGQQPRRVTGVGAGSFGTAVALLLVRAGASTTLLCRTPEQAEELEARRENERYLSGVELPRELKIRALGSRPDQFARPDLVFMAVPSAGFGEALAELRRLGVSERAGVVSLAKGLVPPDGRPPTVVLEEAFGSQRVACVGGPAHAREMVESGAGLVCASHSELLAHRVAEAFQASGVVCEVSDDPVGVELAGVAKNAAAVAVGATQAQGLNAAGMAAADIFLEVLALARASGGRASTFVGRSGTGDLVATALAPKSRNRSAGELLAEGVPAEEIPDRVGQAVEALETVRLLAHAIERSGLEAPVVSALARLIEGKLPLDDGAREGQAAGAGPLRRRPPDVGPIPRLGVPELRKTVSKLVETMKQGIHPEYLPAHVRCTCGNDFWTRSTKPELHVEICSNCHPFYTGKQKLVDTGGRVERFRRRAARRQG